MIRSYTDHAANERTYLAWVRTALAFMGFGLVIERFDLLLRSLRALSSNASGSPWNASPALASSAGLVLILLGILVLVIASYRYLRFKRLIASSEARDFGSSRSDLALVFIVIAIGIFMSVYLVVQVAS